MTQAVFHQAGTLTCAEGRSLAVDAPCLVLLDERTDKLTLADHTQLRADLTVTLNGVSTQIALPQGAHAGSSCTTALSEKSSSAARSAPSSMSSCSTEL